MEAVDEDAAARSRQFTGVGTREDEQRAYAFFCLECRADRIFDDLSFPVWGREVLKNVVFAG